MEERVNMSLETYNKLFLENATLKHELELAKKKVEGIFELEPIYGDDKRISVVLTTTGQALYEEFAAAHPEYEFDSPKRGSFYSVAKRVDPDA